jgi:Bacterial PH domain
MPADSEQAPLPDLPRTWRPLGSRIVGIVLGVGLLVVCGVSWWTFGEDVRDRFSILQRVTLVGFGLLVAAVMYALLRSRAEARSDRLVVVNGYKRREFEWAEIIAVHLPPGAPWVTLDLADGGTVSLLAIQGSDGDRARRAVRELRALVAASSGSHG